MKFKLVINLLFLEILEELSLMLLQFNATNKSNFFFCCIWWLLCFWKHPQTLSAAKDPEHLPSVAYKRGKERGKYHYHYQLSASASYCEHMYAEKVVTDGKMGEYYNVLFLFFFFLFLYTHSHLPCRDQQALQPCWRPFCLFSLCGQRHQLIMQLTINWPVQNCWLSLHIVPAFIFNLIF